jgi:DNA-binding transcriptional ArsR family regulator
MNNDVTLDINEFGGVTKALSDSNRVRALMTLRNGELCVCQIIELLELAPSTVSKHMSILKQAGLVDSRKDSRWVYYRLTKTTNNEQCIGKVIDLSISLLEQDRQILSDDTKMKNITLEGMDSLCKRQRSTTD